MSSVALGPTVGFLVDLRWIYIRDTDGDIATLGARLFRPSLLSRSLGWLLHIGNDFPEPIAQYLTNNWDTTLIIDKETDKPSTRGLLEYKDTTFGRAEFPLIIPIFFLFFFSFHIIDKGIQPGR